MELTGVPLPLRVVPLSLHCPRKNLTKIILQCRRKNVEKGKTPIGQNRVCYILPFSQSHLSCPHARDHSDHYHLPPASTHSLMSLATSMVKFLSSGSPDEKLTIETTSKVQAGENVVDFPAAREKSLHRTVGLLALTGQSRAQIADTLQLKQELVDAIHDSPEVLNLFRREMEARGKYVVKKLLQGAAVDAILTIQDLAKRGPELDPTSINAARVRLSAARELLDRAYGKPTQKVGMDEDLGEGDPEAELLQIKGQIAELEKQRQGRLAS